MIIVPMMMSGQGNVCTLAKGLRSIRDDPREVEAGQVKLVLARYNKKETTRRKQRESVHESLDDLLLARVIRVLEWVRINPRRGSENTQGKIDCTVNPGCTLGVRARRIRREGEARYRTARPARVVGSRPGNLGEVERSRGGHLFQPIMMVVQSSPYDVPKEIWPSVGPILNNRGPVWLDVRPRGTDVHQHKTYCDDPQRSAVGLEKSHQSAAKGGARKGKQEFPDCASGRDNQSEETKMKSAKMNSANIPTEGDVFPAPLKYWPVFDHHDSSRHKECEKIPEHR